MEVTPFRHMLYDLARIHEKIDQAALNKLIQVFEEEPVFKSGTDTKLPVDVRIIAATHPGIGRLVETGKFRKDLYFRLNVIKIEIPPLRNPIRQVFEKVSVVRWME